MYQAGVAASWGSNLDIVLRLNISPNEKTGVLDSFDSIQLKKLYWYNYYTVHRQLTNLHRQLTNLHRQFTNLNSRLFRTKKSENRCFPLSKTKRKCWMIKLNLDKTLPWGRPYSLHIATSCGCVVNMHGQVLTLFISWLLVFHTGIDSQNGYRKNCQRLSYRAGHFATTV